MAVWMFYIDESHDDAQFVLSAIAIRHSDWQECFAEVKSHRQRLKTDFGVFLRKEIHAHELVAGRGNISDRVVGKWERSRIFLNLLNLVARLPGVMLFNVCLKKSEHRDPQLVAWDRLLNRIERTLLQMEKVEIPKRKTLATKISAGLNESELEELSYRLNRYHPRALIFADEGREHEIRKIMRKMHVFNPIPSQFGQWGNAGVTKSIPLERIIEDPVFRNSSQSYMIQLADCVAFSLLKKESTPTPRIKKYGIEKMFESCLQGVCFKAASPSDPYGIVRK